MGLLQTEQEADLCLLEDFRMKAVPHQEVLFRDNKFSFAILVAPRDSYPS